MPLMMMGVPLAEHLDLLRAQPVAALFPIGNFERLRAAVDYVPAAAISLYGLECPLDDEDAAADILYSANVACGGRAALAKRPLHPLTADATPKGDGWERLATFCRRWADPNSALFAGADDLWFEHDVGSPGDETLVPSFFFGVRIGAASGTAARTAARAIIEEGLAMLSDEGVPDGLALVADALPDHARIFQVGKMLSRPERQVRLCIDNLKHAEIVALVRRWRGESEAAAVAARIGEVAAAAPSIRLAIDVGDSVGPRIGLECYAQPPQSPPDRERWRTFLALAAARAWCVRERADTLLRLPLLIRATEADGAWPEDLAQKAALFGREIAVQIRLHHLKLTCDAGNPPRLKAYIAVETVWLS